MKTGIQLIAEERERQISQEGWTAENDDEHDNCEIRVAAFCYLDAAIAVGDTPMEEIQKAPPIWPWDKEWWKPTHDPVRNLVKAGALIAAEIDRLQRGAVK